MHMMKKVWEKRPSEINGGEMRIVSEKKRERRNVGNKKRYRNA